MDSLKIRQILKRYLHGEGSPTETQTVEHWYQKLEDEPTVVINGAKEDSVREEIWQDIQIAIREKPNVEKRSGHNWIKVAAAILVFSTIGMLVWQNGYKRPAKTTIDNGFTIVSTKTGEQKLVTLPDGTLLKLNNASSIRIQNDFTRKRHVRIIDGEVYFDVKHDPSHPFIIKSGTLTVQVLGTAFNIRAYSALKKMYVSVTRGKVGVMVPQQPTHFLLKGQQLEFERQHARVTLSTLDEQMLAWQQGNLVLNDAPFDEMAALMNKQYGVHIVAYENAIKRKHFTATFHTYMSSVKALEVIAAIHDFKIKQRRDTIEIYR